MRKCHTCGGRLYRIRRTWKERLLYQAVFRCRECGDRVQEDQWYSFLVGGVSRCPRCGTRRVKGLTGEDKIDQMYRNPFSYLQKYFGGQLHYCAYCRLQYYDLRPRASKVAPEAGNTTVTDTARSGE